MVVSGSHYTEMEERNEGCSRGRKRRELTLVFPQNPHTKMNTKTHTHTQNEMHVTTHTNKVCKTNRPPCT